MAKVPVFSIIGGTIWGNRGAESMLVTVIGQLRISFPNARFNVFSYYPAKDRELIKDENITILDGKPLSLVTRHFVGALICTLCKKAGASLPRSEFFKIAQALAGSDLLLDIGGITFSDGREKYLPYNILSIWPAMLLGWPVVNLARAAGPFKNPLTLFRPKLFFFTVPTSSRAVRRPRNSCGSSITLQKNLILYQISLSFTNQDFRFQWKMRTECPP